MSSCTTTDSSDTRVTILLLTTIALFPTMGSPIVELKNIYPCTEETEVRVYYLFRIDLSGYGKAEREYPVVTYNLTDGEGYISALYSFDMENRYLIKEYDITSPTTGFILFFAGTLEYSPDTETMEIHGFAVFGVSGPI